MFFSVQEFMKNTTPKKIQKLQFKNEFEKSKFTKNLGVHISKLRERKGWSQSEFSRRCKKDRQAIGRIEKGKVVPHLHTLLEMAQVLEVEMSSLLNFSYTNNEGNKLTVFIVDDDSFFLEILKDRLMDIENLNVFSFLTAEECIEQLDKKPDVVFLDHILNSKSSFVMNGLEALPKIKKKSPDTKVIIVSGQDSIEIAEKMMQAGAFFYIKKDKKTFAQIEKKLSLIMSAS